MIVVTMNLVMLSLYPEILIVHDFILGGMDWRVRVISVDCSCLCLFLVTAMVLTSIYHSLHDSMNRLVSITNVVSV